MLRGDVPRLGLAHDVWAMSASLLELFQPADAKPSPFLNADIRTATGGQASSQAALFRAFETYRDIALGNAALTVSDAAFNVRVKDPQQRAAKVRLDAFLRPAAATHPRLIRFLLEQGMHPKPGRRNSARALAAGLRRELPTLGTAAASRVRAFFADAARHSLRASMVAGLEAQGE
jgi:hypothetical protein